MTTDAALYRLMSWLSPSFPVGAYTYSHGLEHVVETGLIHDAETAEAWLTDILELGGGYADLVFLRAAHEASATNAAGGLGDVAAEAACFQPSRELRREAHAQGAAFMKTITAAWPCTALTRLVDAWPGPYPYPVVVGVVAQGHGIEQRAAMTAYGHAFLSNLVSAIIRLVPLGQTDGQRLISRLEAQVADAVDHARSTDLEDFGTSAFKLEIHSMKHENQHTRLFRS